jgi:uncharacterized protein YxeA
MSLFSIIGVVILAVVVVSGTILKLLIRKKREELDGFHGYIKEESDDVEENISDDWKPI